MANFTDKFPAPTSSNILEVLAGSCDGRSVTVGSGTYTFPNVTGIQNISTSIIEITGTSINYVPPSGTKYVGYKWNGKYEATARGGISGFNVVYDGTVVTRAARGFAGNYMGSYHDSEETINLEFIFDLTASSTNKAAGKILSSDWTTTKNIKITGRTYDTSYLGRMHGNTYMDGTSASGVKVFTIPQLVITSYS
jgi:hypothetical protein